MDNGALDGTVPLQLPLDANITAAAVIQPLASPAPLRLRTAEVRVKLLDATPLQLPASLAPALREFVAASLAPGWSLRSLEGSVRPGCTLLSVTALLDGDACAPQRDAQTFEAPGGAARLAAALLSCATAPFFRGQRFSVITPSEVADCAEGAVTGVRCAAPALQLPPLRPLALCSSSPGVLSSVAAPAGAGFRVLARMHGQLLRVQAEQPVAGALLSVTVPACHADGVALFEAEPLGDAGGNSTMLASSSVSARPVLLCRDAAIAAEVASLGDALAALPSGAAADAAIDAAEQLVVLLGYALRPMGECVPQLLALALAAAMRNGWVATTAALLLRVPPSGAVDTAGSTPLHAAARSGRLDMLRAVLSHASYADGRLGHAGAADMHGATPLHAAAALPTAAAAVTMLAAADACTSMAWFAARDARGVTPAAAAASAGWPGFREVHAALAARLSAGRAAAAAACAAVTEEQGLGVQELIWEAALERLTAVQGDAAATGRALLGAALRAPWPQLDNGPCSDDSEGEAEPAAGPASLGRTSFASALRRCVGWDEPSAKEALFVAFMADRNRLVVQMLAALHMLQAAVLFTRVFCIMREGGIPAHPTYSMFTREGSGTFIDSHRFHDPFTGGVVPADSLSYELLLRGCFLYLPVVLLIRLPAALLLAYVAYAPSRRALFARRYESLLCLSCGMEALGGLLFELGAFALLGVVVEYPLNVSLLHAFFNILVHANGPVRPQWNWPMWVIKAAAQLGLLSLFPSLWPRTWAFNSAVWLQQLASAVAVLRARRNDAALRELWRAEQARLHHRATKKLA